MNQQSNKFDHAVFENKKDENKIYDNTENSLNMIRDNVIFFYKYNHTVTCMILSFYKDPSTIRK